MNQILYSRKKEKKAKRIAAFLGVLILLAILVSVIFYIINIGNEKILKGVYINGVYVGNLLKEEATAKINEELEALREKEIVFKMDGEEFKYTCNDLGVSYVSTAITNAYDYGRTGNIISDNYTILSSYFGKKHIVPEGYTIESARLDAIILDMIKGIENSVLDDSYVIEDDKIVITKGHNGINVKTDELKSTIENMINSDTYLDTIEVPVEVGVASRTDIDSLYNKIYVEKVEASYKAGENFEVVKDVIGISFDKVKAKSDYETAKDGDKIEIELIKDIPEVKVEDLNDELFKDVLAEFTTTYDQSYTARVTNLQVAAKNMNGTILYPGDEFSYNEAVGERTAARGFKEAHVFAGGKVVDGLGGGICQVSSTLYNAVLLANLEVTSRTAHMMHTGYVKPSFDATVVYGSIDFKFKNNRETPIKLEATVKNGKACVKIYGLKAENEPTVELESVILETIKYTTVTNYDDTMLEGTSKITQSPMNGYVSEGYKILKDADGNVISRTLISKDTYKQTSKIVVVGTKKAETVTTPTEENSNVSDDKNSESQTQEPSNKEENTNKDLPTGWDTPENPYYNGKN